MRYLGNLIAIIVVVLLVFGAIKFKQSAAYDSFRFQLNEISRFIQNFISVRKHNITMEIKPSRKTPLTFIQIESELAVWMPQVFEKFTEADWDYFWKLIYEPIKIKKGRFTVKGYRTREEVESILRYKYYDLSFLNDATWSELWGVAKVSWQNARE
jgi:hypothetical protein